LGRKKRSYHGRKRKSTISKKFRCGEFRIPMGKKKRKKENEMKRKRTATLLL